MTLVRYLLHHPFIRFAIVGGAGFFVNLGVMTFDTDILGLSFVTGYAFAIFTTMCFTWLGNRYLTFRAHRAHRLSGIVQEWAKFMGANLVGAAVNYFVSVLIVLCAPAPFSNKYGALVCGVLAGLVFNFTLSRKLVFKAPT